MVFNLTSSLSDFGFEAGAESGNQGLGAGIGAAVGLGLDLFGLNAQKNAAQDSLNEFGRQTNKNLGIQFGQLGTRRLQERLTAAQSLQDLELAGEAALASSVQSALESGVAGNSVKALSNAKRLQLDRVKDRIIRRQEALDGELTLQNQALVQRAKTSMLTAAFKLESSLPSTFEIVGSGLQAGIGVGLNFAGDPADIDVDPSDG